MKKAKAKSADVEKVCQRVDTVQAVEGTGGSDAAGTGGAEAPQLAETKVEPETESVTEAEPANPVERLQAKVDALEDSLLRAKADYRNFQRRSAIERSEAIRYANAEMMKPLLGVIDDFERSLAAAEAVDDSEPVIDGVRLVYENLMKVLRLQGLVSIEALHRRFDPSIHEAMMQRPSKDHPPGTVVEEIAKGYRLGERVLRPTKVTVSAAANVEQGSTPAQPEGEPNENG